MHIYDNDEVKKNNHTKVYRKDQFRLETLHEVNSGGEDTDQKRELKYAVNTKQYEARLIHETTDSQQKNL